ncbi:uncharacterized protein LOC131687671 [Topomyia yanbarensis]|uniref:uncharacterized protein LOC131687671 n=1 Tax=Topomyia yanbarensis TaxID=2498891 RepID=UPI00273AE906|nr:uncharacterized protein LOC131687671 [Topomyia yanbarensis]
MLWSDSEIVLAWLKKQLSRLDVFVRNRVIEIQQLTDGLQWNYIRSAANPADIISRGQLPAALLSSGMWWNGPQFLNDPVFTIEIPHDIPDDEIPELKPEIVVTTALIEEQLPVFVKYSSFRKLQRVIAWAYRFINNARKTKTDRIIRSRLTISELRDSLVIIVRVIQHVELGDEIKRIQSNIPCKHINAMNLIYTDNLLRVGGRLMNSQIPEAAKHQLNLPSTSPVTRLLIRTMHIELLHLGPSALISMLQQKIWLRKARSTVRGVIRSCVKCFRVKPSDISQLMGLTETTSYAMLSGQHHWRRLRWSHNGEAGILPSEDCEVVHCGIRLYVDEGRPFGIGVGFDYRRIYCRTSTFSQPPRNGIGITFR